MISSLFRKHQVATSLRLFQFYMLFLLAVEASLIANDMNNLESSTNDSKLDTWGIRGRSSVQMQNSNGDNSAPCGTPWVIESVYTDTDEPIRTYCLISFQKHALML